MTEVKKRLYLLQLEEYSSARYFGWLKKNDISRLEEQKGQLAWTTRTVITVLVSLPGLIFSQSKAIGLANQLIEPVFSLAKKFLFGLAKIKLGFYPHLTKIVITGSYGKTTFKEKLAFALGEDFVLLKSPQNINTKTGIASLIVRQLNSHQQLLIVEAGAYQPGEIKKICQLIKPDFGVVTIIGLMHLERFGSQAKIKKAKLEIVPFIKNRHRLFLPEKNNQFIDFDQTIVEIGQALGLEENKIRNRLAKFSSPDHRLQETVINNNLIILDDSYNANPFGAKRALKKLASFKKYQKIIITPGLIEFGRQQDQLNADLGQQAAKIADILAIVGETNRQALVKGAKIKSSEAKIIFFSKDQVWGEAIRPWLRPPTVILLENDLPDHYF